MDKTEVIFIELPAEEKLRYICDITEKLFLSGESICIHVKDENVAKSLDTLLWTWKEESFIPHVVTNKADLFTDEQVIISDKFASGREMSTLILYEPTTPQEFDKYKYIFDFAETYDETRLKNSRERYKQLKEKYKFKLSFMKLGAFLHS
jgi:DNA polymerase III subunit chi